MARSPLARSVQRLFQISREATRRGLPVDVVAEEGSARRIQRREFLGNTLRAGAATAGLAALAGTAGLPRAAAAKAGGPSIVIVGGGLAGLACAYRLQRRGLNATVYEAANRLGGRCLTRRGYFAEGQTVERGGELIDTGHRAVRQLARQLGLALDDVNAASPRGTEEVYRFFGQPYTFAQATADFLEIFPALDNDVTASGYPTLYNSSTPRGRELDQMTVAEYIDEVVPGGHGSPLGQMLDVAYNIEFGAECDDQSALNLLYLLGYSTPGRFEIFGESDERYHIRGGNDQLVTGMADALAGQIELGHELVAVSRSADGRAVATFKVGGVTRVVSADHLVLALPFSILRHSVDLSNSGFSPLKMTAIREQGFGANTKFHLQFTDRHWNGLGCNGGTYADTGYQNTWEATRAQAGQGGILLNYTGGNIARAYNRPAAQLVPGFLSQVEPVLPGLSAKYNGLATVDYWPGYRWTRGSYAYMRVGQYTQFVGYEAVQEANVHFCGEHTSVDFLGYLNGAVESGENVAREILGQV